VTMISYCYGSELMRINLRVGAIAGGKDASDSIRETAAAGKCRMCRVFQFIRDILKIYL